MKIRGSLYGQEVFFSYVNWPFGSIEINDAVIVCKGFPFTNETISKNSIQKIEIKTSPFNKFHFKYVKDGKERDMVFWSITKDRTKNILDVLNNHKYIIS